MAEEHIERNRRAWDLWAADFAGPGELAWASPNPHWGEWHVPDRDVRALPLELDGKDAIELGCGTAYISAWLARRGARPVGIDLSSEQLGTARRLQAEHGLRFPLVHGDAEHLPFRDERFDLAISEYGASIWADPYRWIPEAARVVRPGGELVFLVNGVLVALCTPPGGSRPGATLEREYFDLHRFDWPDSVEFHLGSGDMIRLLRRCGFEVEDLIELRPPEGAVERQRSDDDEMPSLEWSRRWPSEEIWKARKRG